MLCELLVYILLDETEIEIEVESLFDSNADLDAREGVDDESV